MSDTLRIDDNVMGLPTLSVIDNIINDIKSQKFKIVCLNDGININNFEKTKYEINEALSFVLPNKCSFEKSDTI